MSEKIEIYWRLVKEKVHKLIAHSKQYPLFLPFIFVIVLSVIVIILIVGFTIFTPTDKGSVSYDYSYSCDAWHEDVSVWGYVKNDFDYVLEGVTIEIIIHDYSPHCPSDPRYREWIQIGNLQPGERKTFREVYDVPIYDPSYVRVELVDIYY